MLRYTVFKVKFGWLGLVSGPKGLLSLILSERKGKISNEIKERFLNPKLVFDPSSFEEISTKLVDYFEGKGVIFNNQLDLSISTPFQRRVWKVVQRIPYGQTQSYLWVAKKVKASPRAVGQALKRNPLPIIIPCHRVIQKNGHLGGYSAGLEWKRRLLSLERLNAQLSLN